MEVKSLDCLPAPLLERTANRATSKGLNMNMAKVERGRQKIFRVSGLFSSFFLSFLLSLLPPLARSLLRSPVTPPSRTSYILFVVIIAEGDKKVGKVFYPKNNLHPTTFPITQQVPPSPL